MEKKFILISNAYSSEEDFISSNVIGVYSSKEDAMQVAKSYANEDIAIINNEESNLNVFMGDTEISYYYNLGSDESVQYIIHEINC